MSIRYERVHIAIEGPKHGPYTLQVTKTINDGEKIVTETVEKQCDLLGWALDYVNQNY